MLLLIAITAVYFVTAHFVGRRAVVQEGLRRVGRYEKAKDDLEDVLTTGKYYTRAFEVGLSQAEDALTDSFVGTYLRSGLTWPISAIVLVGMGIIDGAAASGRGAKRGLNKMLISNNPVLKPKLDIDIAKLEKANGIEQVDPAHPRPAGGTAYVAKKEVQASIQTPPKPDFSPDLTYMDYQMRAIERGIKDLERRSSRAHFETEHFCEDCGQSIYNHNTDMHNTKMVSQRDDMTEDFCDVCGQSPNDHTNCHEIKTLQRRDLARRDSKI